MPDQRPAADRFLACNGPAIRDLRLHRGWTQEVLAERSGYSKRLVQKAEAGGTLAPATLGILAETLACEEKPVQVVDLVRTPLSIVEEFLTIIREQGTNTGPAAAHLIADDFVMWCAGDPTVIPFAGEWHGVEGLTEIFQIFFSVLEPAPGGLHQNCHFITNGPIVSCWAESHASVRGMADASSPIGTNLRFEVRDGKIVRYDNLFDTQSGANHLAEARAKNLLDENWTPEKLE